MALDICKLTMYFLESNLQNDVADMEYISTDDNVSYSLHVIEPTYANDKETFARIQTCVAYEVVTPPLPPK